MWKKIEKQAFESQLQCDQIAIVHNSLITSSWARQRYQVALVPGIAFGNPKCLRLSYAATKENITETPWQWSAAFTYLFDIE